MKKIENTVTYLKGSVFVSMFVSTLYTVLRILLSGDLHIQAFQRS